MNERVRDAAIKAAYEKGNSPAAISKLLDHSLEYVNGVLGLHDEPVTRVGIHPDYTPEALEAVASEALYKLACEVHDNPVAFKPSEAIAILRESLDRTKGKAVQTTIMDQRTTYTIIAAIPAPPNSVGLPAIDIECEAHIEQ